VLYVLDQEHLAGASCLPVHAAMHLEQPREPLADGLPTRDDIEANLGRLCCHLNDSIIVERYDGIGGVKRASPIDVGPPPLGVDVGLLQEEAALSSYDALRGSGAIT